MCCNNVLATILIVKGTFVNEWELTRESFLTEDEVDALLNHLNQNELESTGDARLATATDRVIVETLLYSGLRNTEFCRLRVADTIVGTKTSTVRVEGTPNQDRTVYVHTSLSSLHREYVRDVRPKLLPDDVSPKDLSQPLIFNERGRPYERTALYRRVVRILSEAGLGARASVQLLRHTYGYLAYLRTSGNLLFVQRQLGHAHPMVTAIYAQFVEHPYDQLANQVAATDLSSKPSRPSRKAHE